jgi:hypothetical protein
MSTPADLELLKRAIHDLGEHFTTVQIFVTKTEGGYTDLLSQGEGSYCARYGNVKEWVIREEERMRLKVRKQEEG